MRIIPNINQETKFEYFLVYVEGYAETVFTGVA